MYRFFTFRVSLFVLLAGVMGQFVLAQETLDQETRPSATEPHELLAVQTKIQTLLPRLIPAVVSVPGGSGVIVSSDGIVLTVSHVTRPAGRLIEVRLANGRSVMATTLGSHAISDTGAIKLDGDGPWPFLSVEDVAEVKDVAEESSSTAKPGQWCLALGYPLSFPRGQPAAIRLGQVISVSEQQIVTDCAIMGGDSGGPLVSLDGQLLGINSRVKSAVAKNIHTPIQQFVDQWAALAERRDVNQPMPSHPGKATSARTWFGVLGDADPDVARVRKVQRNSPAAAAGLAVEDIITSLDGVAINEFRDVVLVLRQHQPGDKMVATINRSGQMIELKIVLRERP